MLNVSNYLFPGIGMEPPYLGITSPPRELLASVVPAVSLDKSHRLGKVNIAIKVGEEFLIAHGVERIKATKWIDSLGLLHHTRLDHQLDALINSLVELLAISGEPWDDELFSDESVAEGDIDLEGFDIADAESLY